MKLKSPRLLLSLAGLGLGLTILVVAGAGGPPEAPKVSAFAPVEDLVREADKYIGELADTIAAVESGEEKYDDSKEKIEKDANTLAIIALCLGKHDEDNKYKPVAGA